VVELEPDTFLTIENKLVKRGIHFCRLTGLEVPRSPDVAANLEPTIGLV
jgi:hypothetical protein